MKLATYRDGSRDGQLVVVSRDLRTAHYASGAATRLQQVLDDWNFVSPQLEELARGLEQGRLRHAFAFDPAECLAPLPRAGCRVALASGSAPPAAPRFVQLPGDAGIGPSDAVQCGADATGVDFEVSLAVATGDVPRGLDAAAALETVRLVLLACDLVARGDADPVDADGADAEMPLLATAFAPVAVTPDELEGGWQAGRLHRTIECWRDARRVGRLEAAGTAFGFGAAIAALAARRGLGAGTLVGSAALTAAADGSGGHSSIAEKRRQEAARGSTSRTPWLSATAGALRIDGGSVFGSIEPRLVVPLR